MLLMEQILLVTALPLGRLVMENALEQEETATATQDPVILLTAQAIFLPDMCALVLEHKQQYLHLITATMTKIVMLVTAQLLNGGPLVMAQAAAGQPVTILIQPHKQFMLKAVNHLTMIAQLAEQPSAVMEAGHARTVVLKEEMNCCATAVLMPVM